MENNNIQNPFIGLRTYEESDAVFFRGRKSSTSDLYSLISENDVVVLHAESGEGKSSLLNAGLFPMLRDERFFPIKISFTEEDYALENPNFDRIVYQRIVDCVNQINGDAPDTKVLRDTPNLNGKITITPIIGVDTKLSHNNDLRQCSWWLLRNFTLNAYGASLIPVLVFDQFEEVFTRPKSNTWTEDFFIWLSRTLDNAVPKNVIDLIREIIGADTEFPQIGSDKKFKALFSLRTEYMGELDYWGIQRHHITVLKNSRYCLKPLTEHEADEVLGLQPIFTPQIREQIKRAIKSSNGSKRIQSNLPTIPAMLLSVVGTTATNNIVKKGIAFDNLHEINDNGFSTDVFTNIIDQFYQKEISNANIPRRVIKQIENVLVDDKGKRVRIKADSKDLRKINFETKYKPILEKNRLIKCTQINGDEYVELTHDALAKVISNNRAKQAENSAKIKSWGIYIIEGITFLLSVIFAISYLYMIATESQKIILKIPVIGRTVINLFFIQALIITITGFLIRSIQNIRNRYKLLIFGILYYIVTYFGFMKWFFIREIPFHEYNFRITRGFIANIDFHHAITSCVCVLLSLIFIIGLYLNRCKKMLFRVVSILMILCAFTVPVIFYGQIFAILSIGIVLFILSPFAFIKDRTSGYFLLIASCLMYLTSLLVNGRDVIDTSIIMCVWFAILGIGYLFFRKGYTLRDQIAILKSGNFLQKFPIVHRSFDLYLIIILLIVSWHVGLIMEPIQSLVGMMIICPILLVGVLRLFYKSNILANKAYLWLQILFIELCVILIWISQFTFSHFIIVICSILILIAGEIILSLYNKVPFKFSLKINQTLSYAASSLFAVVVGAYLILGFNYFTKDEFQRVYGENLSLQMYRTPSYDDIKLQFIKNKSNKIGLRDRNGKIVISPMYDQVYNYDRSFDNIYSYFESPNDFNIIFILNGNPIKWNIYDHLHERNALTDAFCFHSKGEGYEYCISGSAPSLQELSVFIGAQRLREDNKSYVKYAESKIIENITSSVNYSQNSNNHKSIKSFNPNDTTHLKLLKSLNYTQLPWELLPYTSEEYRKQFYNKILPYTNLIKSYSDSTERYEYILCSDYFNDVEKEFESPNFLNSKSIDGKTKTTEDYLSYYIGDLYKYVAKAEFLSGNYSKSINVCKNSYNKYMFTEPILPIQIASLLLNGDFSEAKSLIEVHRDELIRINNGLEIPDPALDNAWYFLQYVTNMKLVDNLLQLAKRYGVNISHWDYINKLLDEQKQLSAYKQMPDYDMIQRVLTQNDKEEILRFVKWDGGTVDDGRIYGYSYFVVNGNLSSPLISSWCYGGDRENDTFDYPFLTIDYVSHKRKFIKSVEGNLDKTKFHPWTFIGDEYDHAWTFHEGLAAVEIHGKIGFIDTKGRIVIAPQFTTPYKVGKQLGSKIFGLYSAKNYKMPCFKNGVCPVYDKQGNLVWIDKSGDLVGEHKSLLRDGIE